MGFYRHMDPRRPPQCATCTRAHEQKAGGAGEAWKDQARASSGAPLVLPQQVPGHVRGRHRQHRMAGCLAFWEQGHGGQQSVPTWLLCPGTS